MTTGIHLKLESFIVLQEQLLTQIAPNYAFILSSSYLHSVGLMLFKFSFGTAIDVNSDRGIKLHMQHDTSKKVKLLN